MARSDVLVTTDWAESNLDAPNTVFVEVDEDASPPTTADTSPARSSSTGRPTCRTRSSATSSTHSSSRSCCPTRGIGNDDTVILYGGNNNWFAAYAYWYFKLYGHENVKLLDGGRKKWELDGRPLSADAVSRPATSYTAKAAGQQHPRVPRRGHRRHRREEPRRRPLPRRVLRQDPRPGAPAAGAEPAAGPHPQRHQRSVEQGGQRGRHLQVRRRPGQAVRRGRPGRREGDHRLLPDR